MQVRVVASPLEIKRWDSLIREHHYLGLTNLVGETLRYVAEVDGQWVALLGFASPALKVTARDQFIGWTPEQLEQRRIYVAQNARFLILPGYHIPNLGSRVLGLTLRRLSDDWQVAHGHPVLVCETFVDPSRFDGGVYRAAGFVHVGETSGFAKSGNRWTEHNQPKLVWLRPLRRRALELLRQDLLTPELARGAAVVDPNTLPLNGSRGLVGYMQGVSDPRMRRGVRHPVASVLAVAALAVICGMRSYRAIGQWCQALSQDQLLHLGCFRSPTTGRYVAPSQDTVRRVLTNVDAAALDRAVCAYLVAVLAPPGQRRIALDGKTLRGSASESANQRHLLSAVRHGLGTVLAQVEVDGKENEIPAAQRLLEILPPAGMVVTADAMHTQEQTAKAIVEAGGEYLFTVKDNQPSLHQTLAALDWAFSPLLGNDGQGPRPGGTTVDPGPSHPERPGLCVRGASGSD
ncbi:MAG: ISAs1 family transposase [Acidimicrobiales bacterium]